MNSGGQRKESPMAVIFGNAKTIKMMVKMDLQTIILMVWGQQMRFHFTKKDIDDILNDAKEYRIEERERVRTILYQQMRKYTYLFQ